MKCNICGKEVSNNTYKYHVARCEMKKSLENKKVEELEELTDEEIEEKVEEMHEGAGYYTLPDGNKVRGKDKAIEAYKELLKAGE